MKKMFLSTTIIFGMLLFATSFACAYSMWDIEVGDTLKITDYNSNYGGEFYGAGMFTITASNGTSHIDDFTSWCAELEENTTSGVAYTIQSLYKPSAQSAWLLTKYYQGDWTQLTDNSEQAQFQRALWSFDSGYSINEFYKDDGSLTDYITLANTAVAAGWTNNNYIFIAELDYLLDDQNVDRQNLYVPGNPVPEPATMFLFGIGLLCLGVLGRKKRI